MSWITEVNKLIAPNRIEPLSNGQFRVHGDLAQIREKVNVKHLKKKISDLSVQLINLEKKLNLIFRKLNWIFLKLRQIQ